MYVNLFWFIPILFTMIVIAVIGVSIEVAHKLGRSGACVAFTALVIVLAIYWAWTLLD